MQKNFRRLLEVGLVEAGEIILRVLILPLGPDSFKSAGVMVVRLGKVNTRNRTRHRMKQRYANPTPKLDFFPQMENHPFSGVLEVGQFPANQYT